MRYDTLGLIASFADDATEDLFHGRRTSRARRFPADVVAAALRNLDSLNAAQAFDDLKAPPGNRLKPLRGDLAGRYSIRVNDQWRIVLRWQSNDAHDVWLTDYHS
jgi:proteic killer suppression protein